MGSVGLDKQDYCELQDMTSHVEIGQSIIDFLLFIRERPSVVGRFYIWVN